MDCDTDIYHQQNYDNDDWAPRYAAITLQMMRNTENTGEKLREKMRERTGRTGEIDVG